MKLFTWITDPSALGYLASAAPSSPPPRSKTVRRPRPPARPIPWRTVAKLHAPVAIALLTLEFAHLVTDVPPVVVAAWQSLVAAASAAVPTVLAALVFVLFVVVLKRRRR